MSVISVVSLHTEHTALSVPCQARDATIPICLRHKKINLSTVFACQDVGIKEVEEGIWMVSSMEYDLGYIDLEEKILQPCHKAFGSKV